MSHQPRYDPNTTGILPKFSIGTIIYHPELGVVSYLIDKKFIGIKNYSYKQMKEMLNLQSLHEVHSQASIEMWYYKFKFPCDPGPNRFNGCTMLDNWINEEELEKLVTFGGWIIQG